MDNPLRIVFMGTPHFALGVLQTLVARHYPIVGVVSAPDKPAGRGLMLQSTPVSEYARTQNIPLAQPPLLKDPAFLSLLQSWNPDIMVVVAFRMLPQEVWTLPRSGTFNLHASLLPQYRGAAPINHALIRGETVTGVTTFLIDHQIDTGNILFQESLAIAPDDTAGTLHDRLMVLGAELVCRTLDALSSGAIHPLPQPQISPLFGAPKLNKEMCRIQWDSDPHTLSNLIRGLSPHPAAFALLQNNNAVSSTSPSSVPPSSVSPSSVSSLSSIPLSSISPSSVLPSSVSPLSVPPSSLSPSSVSPLSVPPSSISPVSPPSVPFPVKIFSATPITAPHPHPPGSIVSDHKTYLHVACRGGWLSITDLQVAGKKRMSVKDFLAGFRNLSTLRFT